jgi:hydroxyacylglutathione hydrolase
MVNGYQVARNVDRALFSGDTLFVGGIGKIFEGEYPGDPMHPKYVENMRLFHFRIDINTKVFPGHDVAIKNLEFCEVVDPKNKFVKQAQNWALEMKNKGMAAVPTTIAHEAKYNVFLRCTYDEIIKITEQETPNDCMSYLIDWKEDGKRPIQEEASSCEPVIKLGPNEYVSGHANEIVTMD